MSTIILLCSRTPVQGSHIIIYTCIYEIIKVGCFVINFVKRLTYSRTSQCIEKLQKE